MNSSNSLACCSGVMPMRVSATASSIQSRPLATLRARRVTSPPLVNLQALLNRLSRICRSRMGSTVNAPSFSWASMTRRFLFCSASCPAVPTTSLISGASCTVCGLSSSFPASIFDRSSTWLIRSKQVSTSAVHALQRLLRLFGAKARRVFDQHVGQSDDGIDRGAQLVAHAGHELRLVLARLRQLLALVLDFVEQADVLDRDHRLVGEGGQKLNLLFGKRANLLAREAEDANRDSLAHERNTQHRMKSADF